MNQTMEGKSGTALRAELKAPRAGGIADIVFSILIIT